MSNCPPDRTNIPARWKAGPTRKGRFEKRWKRWGSLTPSTPGKGSFTGQKSILKIKDSLGRQWQCSTVQVDFNNPERFHIHFRDEKGGETQVFMIHRALLGSLERFFGVLIEHYAGRFRCGWLPSRQRCFPFPTSFWSTPTRRGRSELEKSRVCAPIDQHGNADKIGAKIREATMQKIPYMLVVGGREAETKRSRSAPGRGKIWGRLSVGEAIARLKKEVAKKFKINLIKGETHE
jgi:threonyl-tRNA synthetase